MGKTKDGLTSMRGFRCAAGGGCSHPSTCRQLGCAANFISTNKETESPSDPALLSASPFEFKVVDDHIVRFKRDSGEEFGKVHKDDADSLCLLISDLDSDLWQARRGRTSLEKKHNEMIEKISEAISG